MKSDKQEFKWPEFKNDRERIKFYSQKFKDLSVKEAFEQVYNLDLSHVKDTANDVPNELSVGDIISVYIKDISKNKVDFDTANFKTTMQSSVNLHKYEKFKHFIPKDKIKVRVKSVIRDKVVVDPITPMVDDWLGPIVANPNCQKIMNNPQSITVKNLQLTRGGFMGEAVIPNVSNFVGEDFTLDAFIPGSQIVLNITDDFEQFIGKSVEVFVLNYIPKPGNHSQMSLICSAKELIKFKGEQLMIPIFDAWCDDSDYWKEILDTTFIGKVTGIINSSKKCGVFIEIPELNITGMVQTKPDELVNYKRHDEISVKITGFEEEMFYNSTMKQMQHVDPYTIKDGILEKCSLKPILKFA